MLNETFSMTFKHRETHQNFFKITAEEKKLVDEVFQNAMMVLSEEDRALPQVENVLPLLKRGIGIHHGGLLPILKETTEILFGEGLIKGLFTFSNSAVCLHFQLQLFVYLFNCSCLFTFLITAVCLHFKFHLFVYISNFSCLFTFQVVTSAVS